MAWTEALVPAMSGKEAPEVNGKLSDLSNKASVVDEKRPPSEGGCAPPFFLTEEGVYLKNEWADVTYLFLLERLTSRSEKNSVYTGQRLHAAHWATHVGFLIRHGQIQESRAPQINKVPSRYRSLKPMPVRSSPSCSALILLLRHHYLNSTPLII